MYSMFNALILALLVPTGGVENAQDEPACRAELEGTNLLTTFAMPNGVTVEGPWRLMHRAEVRDGEPHFTMFAMLDHVVEKDMLTGTSTTIRFPEPVRLVFEGNTQTDMVRRAVQVWCVTVMRAQENQALHQLSPNQTRQVRIALLPASGPAA